MSWFRHGTHSQGSSQRDSTVHVQESSDSWLRWVKSCSVVRREALLLRRAMRPRRTMESSIVSMLVVMVSGRDSEREGKNQRRLCVYVNMAPFVGLKRQVWFDQL
jgi:hypothetical protein